MGNWIPLLGVDEAGEMDWIAEEEDWGVVADQIPVSFLSVKLDGISSGITSRIRRSRLATHGREANGNRGALTHLREHARAAVLGDVMGHFEVTESTGICPRS